MSITGEKDYEGILEASRVARNIREILQRHCQPGITTAELDKICQAELRGYGAYSAPMQDYGAPCHAFYSVNNCVVHGLPDHIPLKQGDLVKIDVTPGYNGYISDTACTVLVGESSPHSLAARLAEGVEAAFSRALEECRVGNPVNRIGRAVEASTAASGFHIIPELTGHGVGRAIHEEPAVYNYYEPRQKDRLTEGLVIAIEPMIASRRSEIRTRADKWSIVAPKNVLTAHFEHTVLITMSGPVILTA